MGLAFDFVRHDVDNVLISVSTFGNDAPKVTPFLVMIFQKVIRGPVLRGSPR